MLDENADVMDTDDGSSPMVTSASTSTAVGCCVPLTNRDLTEEDARATAAVFKALGDPHRVRIVNLLAAAAEPVCVCELTPALGIAQSTVSHHLKKLVDAGLLHRERRGTWSYYRLDGEAASRLASIVHFPEVAW